MKIKEQEIAIKSTPFATKTRKLKAKWQAKPGQSIIYAQLNPEELRVGEMVVLARHRRPRYQRIEGLIVDVHVESEIRSVGSVSWADGSVTLIGIANDTRHVSISPWEKWHSGDTKEWADQFEWQDAVIQNFCEYAYASSFHKKMAQNITEEIDSEILEDLRNSLAKQ